MPDLAEMLGQAMATASRRGMRGGRAPPVAARAARCRQDDAGRTNPDHPAAPGRRGGARGHGHPFSGGDLAPAGPAADRSALLAPHHTATKAAIVGGGSGIIVPGSASLAHRGVLFLDEAPEFAKDVLDALRQPLEAGEVMVARSGVISEVPGQVHPGAGREPVPMRKCRRGGRGLQLQPGHPPPVPGPDLGPAARPGRREDRARAGGPQGTAERPEFRRVKPDRGATRGRRPGTGPLAGCAARPGA